MADPSPNDSDSREKYFVDIDRMINEGLGGGQVTDDNGLIEDTTAHTLEFPESVQEDTANPEMTANRSKVDKKGGV